MKDKTETAVLVDWKKTVDIKMMMASAKLVRDCSSELSSDVRSLSVSSSIEEQDSTTTDSEYTEEEKEYELDDLQMLKTIGEYLP